MKQIKWLDEPEEHNYPAAKSYLSLIYNDDKINSLIDELKEASITKFKAKDIFRASRLSLLGMKNSQVKKNLKKIKNGESLSPILLVRDSINGYVIIADGFHRLSAVYGIFESYEIPCKII